VFWLESRKEIDYLWEDNIKNDLIEVWWGGIG
jgi:hypothetical protein